MNAIIILYVRDQNRSREFYRRVLASEPSLDVPGMTEFPINSETSLGLMPESGIRKLLGETLPDPSRANGIPRAELYLRVDNAAEFQRRALAAGAGELSALSFRSWGESVAYCLDPDGHVIAIADSKPSV